MKTLIAGLILLVSMSGISHAGALKDENERDKKCANEATRYFREVWGEKGEDRTDRYIAKAQFKSKFDKEMNACLLLINVKTVKYPPSKEITFSKHVLNLSENYKSDNRNVGDYLYSVNENRLIACTAKNHFCYSEKEFDESIKIYNFN